MNFDRIIQVFLALALLVVGGLYAYEKAQMRELRTEIAETKLARETAARLDEERKALKEREHAQELAEVSARFAKDAAIRESKLRSSLARADSLLRESDKRAARYIEAGSGDATSCQHLADRSVALDKLLTEGFGLVAEGAGLVEQRDAEVKALLDVVATDRALIE